MNIFKKHKLAQLIDEKAEMLESYRTRIEKFYKENLIYSTWVYHLSDKELQSIGLKRPWECAYYKISGNPKPPLNPYLHDFNTNLKRIPIYYELSQEEIEEHKKNEDEYDRIMSVARGWAKTIGAREVLIFKRNMANQYIAMVTEFANEIVEFTQLNKSVYGQLKDSCWECLIRFAQNKIDEIQNVNYIIERDN